MIEILNNLPSYCKGCQYLTLKVCEMLGSGELAYSCPRLEICERVYRIGNSNKKVHSRWTTKLDKSNGVMHCVCQNCQHSAPLKRVYDMDGTSLDYDITPFCPECGADMREEGSNDKERSSNN